VQIDVSNKVVVVTGAGRGIGREILATFAREGAVVVALDVNLDDLAAITRWLRDEDLSGLALPVDVRDPEQIKAAVDRVVAEYGRIDVLVNNAGVDRGGSVDMLGSDDWDLVQDVNLKGVFQMCRAVIPVMKSQRSGRILNAASFAAIVPIVGAAAYAASKAGVAQFSRTLAGEVGPWGITVNSYAPGMVPTTLNGFTGRPVAEQDRLLDTLTLRRWGTADDIAQLLCFLASDLAGYITGTLINVSGGKLATQIPRLAYDSVSEPSEG
jgi:3-oxoacyl-[acyl-carrier protein] reductase